MWRYIARRTLHMIPTVFGVILITFMLFNVVGGSPASMTLGKNVSPKALEDFDEVRGANKPLIFGWWARTRALEDLDSGRSSAGWRRLDGVSVLAASNGAPDQLILSPGAARVLLLAFALKDGTSYRLSLAYRCDSEGAALVVLQGSGVVDRVALPAASRWVSRRIDFGAGAEPAGLKLALEPGSAPVEIRDLKLRRRMPHPFDSQLLFYLRQLAHLDFGVSTYTNQRVSAMLRGGVVPSLVLTVPIFIADFVLAVGIALVCAFFRNTWIDRFFVVASVGLMSIPYLVWIVAGQYILAFKLGWFPIWGFESWRYLLLPVLIGTVSGLGGGIRFYRTVMLDEMYKDYVRTAFAKGVSRPGVLFRHVLKNAMIPILTDVVITIPFLYTGSLLLESFFGIPGLGYLSVQALNSSDADVVRAVVLIGAMIYVVANLLTDICYALVDPRVKLR